MCTRVTKQAHRAGGAVVIALSCVLAACDGVVMVVNSGGPSVITSQLKYVRVHPDVLVAAPLVPHSCPGVQPLSVDFSVNVHAGTSPMTIRQVRFFSTDHAGVASTVTVVDGSALMHGFGTVTVPKQGHVSYPFTHAFGCGVSTRVATLHAEIRASDDDTGQSEVMRVEAPVR